MFHAGFRLSVASGHWTVGAYRVNVTRLKMSAHKFLVAFYKAQYFYLLLCFPTRIARVRYFPISYNTLRNIIGI